MYYDITMAPLRLVKPLCWTVSSWDVLEPAVDLQLIWRTALTHPPRTDN